MIIKGMWGWMDYFAEQLDLSCEMTPWGKRYMIPPPNGRGEIEAIEVPGMWAIWKCNIVINKEIKTAYAQENPYYISFAYRETSFAGKTRESSWPTDEVIDFQSEAGMSMKGIGVFIYTQFFENLVAHDMIDLILSMQSYDNDVMMKPLTPILRQMFEYSGEGLAMRLFMESRLLELASVLIMMAQAENSGAKITLSPFDSSQLHKVLEILADSLAAPPGISELSRMVALNEYKLKIGFKQLFGTTIYEYLRLLRMEKAVELLDQKTLSPTQVGQQVGYRTAHGFNNAFKKYYGKTPLEWQQGDSLFI